VNSITIDPHKLGYVPYAAGTILVRDIQDYQQFTPDAPYLDADEVWPGAQTLEGSRSATGCTALWMMAKTLGLHSEGLGRVLARGLKLSADFQNLLRGDRFFLSLPGCHSNLSLFSMRGPHLSNSLAEMNSWVDDAMRRSQSGGINYRLSKTRFQLEQHPWLRQWLQDQAISIDSPRLSALRLVFMNPFLDTKESRVRHLEDMVDQLKTLG
jgi:glutamate/tyrosine decarboxylase-like PLP-dependent enzyme